MAELGVDPANPLDPERREALIALVARITALAQDYERSAEPGIAALPWRARWAVLSARGIYGGIGRKVASLGSAAWDERVVVPRSQKLAIMLASLARAVRPA
jgi:phytoene synthase